MKKKRDKVADQFNLFGLIRKNKAEIQRCAKEILHQQKLLSQLEREKLLSGREPLSWANGFTLVPNDLITAPDIADPEKMAYINLLRYAFRKKTAWPSESRMATERKISIRQQQRHITRLVRRAYLWVELVVTPQGGRYYNRYHLNIEDFTRKE